MKPYMGKTRSILLFTELGIVVSKKYCVFAKTFCVNESKINIGTIQ
jgi:hypothetical protein